MLYIVDIFSHVKDVHLPPTQHTHFCNMLSPLNLMNLIVQAALEERDREVQSAWEQKKESLAEVEKVKEEMEEAKRKMERNRMTIEMMEAQNVTQEKPEEDNLELFRALAEKLGETFESVGGIEMTTYNCYIIMSRCVA